MNLTKLFETQAKLDEHIMQEHPELRWQDNLDWKLLALQVELGECANEWRGFKKWSKDQEPRTAEKIECFTCAGTGDENYEFVSEAAEGNGGHEYCECESCNGTGYDGTRNPLLEEYVDCLHFILSIGLEHTFNEFVEELEIESLKLRDVTQQFTALMRTDWEIYEEWQGGYYHEGLELFIGLGEMLGFTWEQVEEAYFKKNQINHERQESGY